MQITLKLYATLGRYLPPGADKGIVSLDVAEGVAVGAVVEQLDLPRNLVHLVLLNGVYIAPEAQAETRLSEADTLAIWPPVAGG